MIDLCDIHSSPDSLSANPLSYLIPSRPYYGYCYGHQSPDKDDYRRGFAIDY